MGLDITAYSKVEKIAEIPYNKHGIDWDRIDELEGDYCVLHKHDSFPTHCEDLDEAVYKVNGESHGFRAGSYSGYSRFRNLLSEVLVGGTDKEVWEDPEKFKVRPFYELINFSDCEGCIGPKVSAKLYQDFVENEDRFLKSISVMKNEFDLEWIKTCYSNWKKAFELAKDQGFVHFH